jgi:aminoglycoside phosphotransferase (APT) family kinase protein
MDLISFLPQVIEYMGQIELDSLPGWQKEDPFQVAPLAQGEYNINYLIRQSDRRWVLRVNLGTQINRDDQITYEYRALRLLEASGVTPHPYFLDDSLSKLEYGLLIMEYIPGESLDYQRDLQPAAGLFARLHSLNIPEGRNHLIRVDRPLSGMVEECLRLADVYLNSELADPVVRQYFSEVLEWAQEARAAETYYLADPCYCVINTEVNSGNFILNRQTGAIHLVDWEKPLWGDPSQDLSHFSVPTTTLWKTDYRMPPEDRLMFLNAYRDKLSDRHLRDTIAERVRLRDPFNCLRGISWSAMAWVQYQTGEHALRNPDTFRKMQAYLDLFFLRSLFDPYLQAGW